MTENAHLEDGDLKALFAEARRLLDRGEAARALSVAKELIQNHPDSVQAHFFAGIAARQDGDVEHAIVFLKRAARLAPQEAELWPKRGAGRWYCVLDLR